MSGLPVIWVGPRGGYRGKERTLVASLLQRGRTLHEIDIVSEESGATHPLRAIVERIREAVRELGQRSVTADRSPALIGYSIGAQAAAQFAAEHPGSVSSVTLIAGWMESSSKMQAVRELWRSGTGGASGREEGNREVLVRAAHLVLASARGWPGELGAWELPRATAETEALLELCDDASLGGIAEEISDPVLIVGGLDDEFATVQQSRLLFGAISDSRYAEIACGHLACIERPAEVFSLVESFIAAPLAHAAGSKLDGHRA